MLMLSETPRDLLLLTDALTDHPSLDRFHWDGHLALIGGGDTHADNNNNNAGTATPHIYYESMATALATCTHLQSVSLVVPLDPIDPDWRPPDISDNTLRKLLMSPSKLTDLSIWTDSWIVIANILSDRDCHVERLSLFKVRVNVQDCQALADALLMKKKENTTSLSLKMISLTSSSGFDDEMLLLLARALEQNHHITTTIKSNAIKSDKEEKSNSYHPIR